MPRGAKRRILAALEYQSVEGVVEEEVEGDVVGEQHPPKHALKHLLKKAYMAPKLRRQSEKKSCAANLGRLFIPYPI